MYNFSMSISDLFQKIEKRTNDLGIKTIGSEFILSEMLNIEGGIFAFLMNEYDVKKQEIIEETNNLLVFRKEASKYSKVLTNILDYAKSISYGKIKEEHLLYSILNHEDSIAYKIITSLGMSPNDLKLDLEEIYDFKDLKEDLKYTINLTLKAQENKLDNLYEYDDYLKRMLVILNKKYKNNPLIIGEAGVGKTALVEGFAKYSYVHNLGYEVLMLNLSSMLSNTKYRGDFEARLDEVMNYIKEHQNVILFIDEIHTIIGTGSSENSLDVANILKPYLARSDIKIIGATTQDEYQKTIFKDKALRRRFDIINVLEPTLDITKRIMLGLKKSYEKFHNLKIDDSLILYLCDEADFKIHNKRRPDKCIDILDEMLSFSKLNNIIPKKDTIDYIINQRIGYHKYNNDYHYKEILKLKFLDDNNLKEDKNYNYHLAIYENDEALEYLKDDLKTFLGINDEMILTLDAKMYLDKTSKETLLGAPKGYVGYEEDGILSLQLLKYPMTLLIINNASYIGGPLKVILNQIYENGFIYNSHNTLIKTNHLVILNVLERVKPNLGFNNNVSKLNYNYDLIIDDKYKSSLNDKYINIFNKYKLNYNLCFDILPKHKKELNELIYNAICGINKNSGNLVLNGNAVEIK